MSADRVSVDANVLVYSLYQDAPQHRASRAFLQRANDGELTLCFTSQVLAEFFSVVTSAKRVSNPKTPTEAIAAIEDLLAIPGALLLPVPAETVSRWLNMLADHPVRGGGVFDLQLAATLMANGVQRICTFNGRDFEGIPGLEIVAT